MDQPQPNIGPTSRVCWDATKKKKRWYLPTCKVSRYCLLALYESMLGRTESCFCRQRNMDTAAKIMFNEIIAQVSAYNDNKNGDLNKNSYILKNQTCRIA